MSNSENQSCCNSNSKKSFLKNSKKKIMIDEIKCIGCGICEEVCPFGLPKENSKGKYEIIKQELCVECSACERNCPEQAIILEEQKGCGCLWDARQRHSDKTNTNNKNCCC